MRLLCFSGFGVATGLDPVPDPALFARGGVGLDWLRRELALDRRNPEVDLAVLADEPLLERDEELERLNLLLDAAAGRDGRLAVIEGPAGIGKTRLLAAVRENAAERGMQVFRARGSDLEGEFSYGVVRQLFERPLARAGPERTSLLGGGCLAYLSGIDERARQDSNLRPSVP
jgi:hypothetical protein